MSLAESVSLAWMEGFGIEHNGVALHREATNTALDCNLIQQFIEGLQTDVANIHGVATCHEHHVLLLCVVAKVLKTHFEPHCLVGMLAIIEKEATERVGSGFL